MFFFSICSLSLRERERERERERDLPEDVIECMHKKHNTATVERSMSL